MAKRKILKASRGERHITNSKTEIKHDPWLLSEKIQAR